jgi:hypothetical protein
MAAQPARIQEKKTVLDTFTVGWLIKRLGVWKLAIQFHQVMMPSPHLQFQPSIQALNAIYPWPHVHGPER